MAVPPKRGPTLPGRVSRCERRLALYKICRSHHQFSDEAGGGGVIINQKCTLSGRLSRDVSPGVCDSGRGPRFAASADSRDATRRCSDVTGKLGGSGALRARANPPGGRQLRPFEVFHFCTDLQSRLPQTCALRLRMFSFSHVKSLDFTRNSPCAIKKHSSSAPQRELRGKPTQEGNAVSLFHMVFWGDLTQEGVTSF